MNNIIRKQLKKYAEKLYDLTSEIENLRVEIESIQEEEQEKYDNMSEGWQESERGCNMYEGIESLEDIVNRLDYQVAELYDISEDIERVTEI